MGAPAVRVFGQGRASHHQRSAGDIAGGVRHFGEAAGDDRVGVTQIICKNLVFMSSFAYDLAWLRWSTISMNVLPTDVATLRATKRAPCLVFRSAISPLRSRG